MTLSDLSVKRPVFAMVISLLIASFGYISYERLPLRELPNIDPPVVSVQTGYPGASSGVVETRITQPVEDAIAGIEGIDTISSSSRDGSSQVTITFRLSRDIEAAANDVRNAVARVVDRLPEEADPPQVQKADADGAPIMFLHFTSPTMSRMDLTDYIERYVLDRLSTVDGVSSAGVFGETRSLRIWLDRVALAARGMTVGDVENALRAQNIELPAGRLESTARNLTVRIERGYATEAEFRKLVLSTAADGHMITLGEVAKVEIAARERRSDFRGNGKRQVGVAISKQSTANQLAVARGVRVELEKIRPGLPKGTEMVVAVDYSTFIEDSVKEVYETLAITGGLVLLVIYLFLGNARAALVPAVTVPVCLLGAMALLALFGATINLLTLLALVLAISALVALTLSPMMCSKLLVPVTREGMLSRTIHGATGRLAGAYRAALEASLNRAGWVMLMFVAIVVGAVVLFRLVPGEIAPTEDRGQFDVSVNFPEGAGFDSVHAQMLKIEQSLLPMVKEGTAERVIIRVPGSFGASSDFNSGRGIIVLRPWGKRAPQQAVIEAVTAKLKQFPAIRATAIARSSFSRGGSGTPVQFVLGGSSFVELVEWRDKLMRRAEEFPGLLNVDSDFKETKPQLNVQIDPLRAGALGISVATVGRTLETMLGQRRVGTFIDRGEEYDIILQGLESNRRQPSDLTNILVRAERSGALVPLSNLVTTDESATSSNLNRFNRLRAITISANVAPGTTLGQALDFLERAAREELPSSAQIDYKGQSLEYKESSSSLAFTFGLALLVVLLVLAAQFESFVHPFIIILTVPLAVAGALFGLWATGATLNIYSQIGIVMLVGLAAKNGILIVEFANQLRDQGRTIRDALVEASVTRFRPILMTSLATSMGAVPLMFYGGAGSQSRFAIGIVVFAGVIFSTALTLFVIPSFYLLLARFTTSPGAIAARLSELEIATPDRASGHA